MKNYSPEEIKILELTSILACKSRSLRKELITSIPNTTNIIKSGTTDLSVSLTALELLERYRIDVQEQLNFVDKLLDVVFPPILIENSDEVI